jgi:HPt (histidine-containing phosphotransfer) domain-containing protein
LSLLKQVAARHPHLLRIVLSGHSELEAEVRSARIAHHYFSKPCSFDQLKVALQSVLVPGARRPAKKVEGKDEISPEIQELIPFFLDRRRADLASIRNLLLEENFDGIRLLGHNIKGSSPSYGFPELGQLGVDFEKAALSRDKLLIEQKVASFESQLSQIELAVSPVSRAC